MTISDLITLAESRLAALNGAHATASRLGDVDLVSQLETQIAQTQETLNSLRSLL